MIMVIPVRREIRIVNGAQTPVLEVVPGFCRVTPDDGGTGHNGELLVSNPFIEAFVSRSDVPPNERLYLVLDEIAYSNPCLDDNGPSLTTNDHRVFG